MRRYLSISDRATGRGDRAAADVTHLIWPESAFPFLLDRDASALAQIAALLPPGDSAYHRRCPHRRAAAGRDRRRFFNAIQVVSHDGTDHRHLRQGPSRAVRGVPSEPRRGPGPGDRPAPVRHDAGRLRCRRTAAAPSGRAGPAAGRANDLLRGDLPGGVVAGGSAPGPHPERHQRCLVRRHARSLPAFRPGAPAGGRGGASPRPRRQHRHLGGGRSRTAVWSDALPLGVAGVLDCELCRSQSRRTIYSSTWQYHFGCYGRCVRCIRLSLRA